MGLFFTVSCLRSLSMCLFICALWSPAGKRLSTSTSIGVLDNIHSVDINVEER